MIRCSTFVTYKVQDPTGIRAAAASLTKRQSGLHVERRKRKVPDDAKRWFILTITRRERVQTSMLEHETAALALTMRSTVLSEVPGPHSKVRGKSRPCWRP